MCEELWKACQKGLFLCLSTYTPFVAIRITPNHNGDWRAYAFDKKDWQKVDV